MNIQFDKRKALQLLRILSWGSVLFFIGFTTRGILFDGVLAGWDTQGHLYLAQETSTQLRSGQLMFFDEKWFAGYPAFPLYGPLFYYLISFFSIISFSVFSIPLLFNITIYSFSFLFVFSFVYATKNWFGKSVELVALFCSLLFLLTSKLHNVYGIGIASYTMAGLIPNFLGVILLTLFIGYSKNILSDLVNKKTVFFSALLFSLCFYVNPSIGVFSLLFFLSLWGIQRKNNKQFFQIGLVSLLFLLPQIIGLVRYFPYASSSTIGFSEVATMSLVSVLFFQIDQVFGHLSSFFSSFSIYDIPILGGLTVIGFIAGLYRSFQKKIYIFMVIFGISFVIVFFELDLFVLQSFRFMTLLYLVELFIITFGLYSIVLWLKKKNLSYQSFALLTIVFGLGLYQLLFYQYDLLRDEGYHKLQQYQFNAEQYQQYASLKEVVSFLQENETGNRVAVETTMYMLVELGGLHIGTSYLASNGFSVLPGLLAESSLSSSYIISSMQALDLSIPWGRRSLLDKYTDADLSFIDHIRRLELFGVDKVVAFNPGAKKRFSENENETIFTKELSTNAFIIYELQETKPILDIPEYKPLLFVSDSRNVFREFTESWYLDSSLLPYPVVLVHPNEVDELISRYPEKIGGVIVDTNDDFDIRNIHYNRDKKISQDLALWIKETEKYDQNDESIQIERVSYTPEAKNKNGYWVSPSFILYFK